MKNKKRIVAVLLCSCLLFGGCKREYSEDITIEGGTAFESDNSHIKIDSKYTLQGYEKEYTETGCIVTIYYELRGVNEND